MQSKECFQKILWDARCSQNSEFTKDQNTITKHKNQSQSLLKEEETNGNSKSKKVQFLGTGRRKESVARVRLLPNGKGQITVNKLPYDEYFKLETLKLVALQPLTLTNTREKYDILSMFMVVDSVVKLAQFATALQELSTKQNQIFVLNSKLLECSLVTQE